VDVDVEASDIVGDGLDVEEAEEVLSNSDEESEAEPSSPESEPSIPEKKARKRYVRDIRAKFIDLVDLLPPPPKRGNFDIERTRDSLYFFS